MISQPILSFVKGIDKEARLLSESEVESLTDWFGQWLARTPVSERALSFRSLLDNVLPADSYDIYAVADGISILYDHSNPDNALNSVSRHLRFIVVALPDRNERPRPIIHRTLCIVGSANPNGKDNKAFLQCASWDPKGLDGSLGIMRFYQRGSKGWVYFGDSLNAFNKLSEDKGPFDGHVGGGLIMKELTAPWVHWLDTNRDQFVRSLGSTKNQASKCDPYNALNDVLFSGKNGLPLSLVKRAEDLEPIIELSVTKWYDSRFAKDFLDADKKPLHHISAVKSWVGHALLSRSMNIAASPTSSHDVQQQATISGVPLTLFFNSKAFQRLLPNAGGNSAYSVSNQFYVSAVQYLDLGLFYFDYSTDPPSRKLAVGGTEGPFAFPIIEPGLEDYEGVKTLVNKAQGGISTVLSTKAIACMLMVDFYNPLYSSRRQALFKYVPTTATLKADGKSYDILEQIVANIRASPLSTDPKSAEREFLNLLDTPDEDYQRVFTKRINSYLDKVSSRLSDARTASEAVQEYMALADGRRRMFRELEAAKAPGGQDSLGGLNEFSLTLPFSTRLTDLPMTDMLEDGSVTVRKDPIIIDLPSKSLPTRTLPSKSLPSKSLPSKSLPSKSLPSKSLPSKLLPSKSLPVDIFEEYGGCPAYRHDNAY